MFRPVFSELRRWYSAWTAYGDDHGNLLAAAAAYFIGLSLFPLLSALIAGLGWFLQHTHPGQNAEQQVMLMVEQHVSPVVAAQVQELLAQVREKSPVSGPVSLLTLFFVATAGFVQFEQAFDRIWNTPRPKNRGWLREALDLVLGRLVSFVLLLLIAGIVVLTFLASTILGTVQARTRELLPAPAMVWTIGQAAVSLLINAGAFTLLYRWLPRARVPWRFAFRGALLAAIAWEIGRQALAAFLVGTRYSSAYGIVGTFIGLLVWCYYACTILFLAAEYVQGLVQEHTRGAAAAEIGGNDPGTIVST